MIRIIKAILFVAFFGLVVAHFAMKRGTNPGPGPDPGPGPIGTLHVMYLTDHSKPLTQEQTDAMSAADVLDYEQTHCAKDGWRRFDVSEKPEDVAHDSQFWRDAFAKHGEAPSVTTYTKNRLGTIKPTVHPFPKDVAGMMEILTKAGGK